MVFLSSPLWKIITFTKPTKGPNRFWKRRKMLKMAAHFTGRKQNCYRLSLRYVRRMLRFCTIGRRLKKKDARELNIARVKAACEEHGFTYEHLKENLIRSNVLLNYRILADLACWEPRSFKCLVDFAWNKGVSEGLNGINELGDPPSGVVLKPMILKTAVPLVVFAWKCQQDQSNVATTKE